MKKRLFVYVSGKTLILYGLSAITCIATLFLLPVLPPKVPMVLRPDGKPRPAILLLLTALLPAVATFLFSYVPHEDEQGQPRQRSVSYQTLMWLFAMALLAYHWLIIVNAFEIVATGETVAQIAIALLLIVLGIHLGNLPFGHPGVAIKLSWVVENEELWKRTHREGGAAFILVGLSVLAMVVAVKLPLWALPPSLPTIVLIVGLLVAGTYIMFSSISRYRKLR